MPEPPKPPGAKIILFPLQIPAVQQAEPPSDFSGPAETCCGRKHSSPATMMSGRIFDLRIVAKKYNGFEVAVEKVGVNGSLKTEKEFKEGQRIKGMLTKMHNGRLYFALSGK
jgi:hypothetical protein